VLATSSITHRSSLGPGHVAKLLRALEPLASDVDRVAGRVVDPRDRDHVRRSVRANCRDASELPPAGQVLELALSEDAHRHDPALSGVTRSP
jgi:hypothetical protein